MAMRMLGAKVLLRVRREFHDDQPPARLQHARRFVQRPARIIQEVQHHPLKRNVLHVDFHAVRADEVIHSEIPVETFGESIGVKGYGGTLTEALARRDRSFTQTENANHRTDHAVVGAIVARTWRLPIEVAVAIRLHHDFTCLKDAGFGDTERRLVALGLIADHLVHQHENLPPLREWQQHAAACLAYLEIGEGEVNEWIDALHPAFEAVVLA